MKLEAIKVMAELGKRFRLGPLDLVVDNGALYVKGPNGCGKTTLLRTLCGELKPTSGHVLLDGKNVWTSPVMRRRIGYVPAIPELPDFLSVREAYEFMGSMRGKPGWDGIRYCDQLKLDPNMSLGTASAGQRQKAELIAALAGDPDVLLMDETFSHFDADSSLLLSEWIAGWEASRIVIFTHHGTPPLARYSTFEMR